MGHTATFLSDGNGLHLNCVVVVAWLYAFVQIHQNIHLIQLTETKRSKDNRNDKESDKANSQVQRVSKKLRTETTNLGSLHCLTSALRTINVVRVKPSNQSSSVATNMFNYFPFHLPSAK